MFDPDYEVDDEPIPVMGLLVMFAVWLLTVDLLLFFSPLGNSNADYGQMPIILPGYVGPIAGHKAH